MRIGELLLRTHQGFLTLPIRTEEDLDRLISGERWDTVRGDILARCAREYRRMCPKAQPHHVEAFLRGLFQGRSPSKPGEYTPGLCSALQLE